MASADILKRTTLGSIDGIQFFYTSISAKDGNQLLITEIPNSTRWIRFFGKNEETYTISGYIETDRFKDLEASVKIQELKSFVIPYFGDIDLTINDFERTLANVERVGLIDFKITASYSSNNSSISTSSKKNQVPIAGKDLTTSKLTVFKNFFKSTALSLANIRGKITSVLLNVDSVTASISVLSDEFQLLSTIVSDIESSLSSLITAPANLASSFDSMIETLSYSFSTIDDNLLATFNYAILNKPTEVTTTSQYSQENTINNNMIESYLLSSCCQSYYNVINRRDSHYQDELQTDINRYNSMLLASQNVYDENLRLNIQSFIKNVISYLLSLNEFTIKKREYKTQYIMPSDVLCYNLYGNLDNLTQFLNWNNLYKGQIIEKDINIIFYEM